MRTRTVVIAVVVVSALAALALRFLAGAQGPSGAALNAREQALQSLGERIAKLKPGAKVLVLANPFARESGYFDEKRRFEQAGIQGLAKGLAVAASDVQVVLPQIRPEYLANPQSVVIPPDTQTPLSFLVQASSVEQLANAHPGRQIIVSLIGLPIEIDQLKLWTATDTRCFALLQPDLRLLGSPEIAAQAFRSGKILAVVVENPVSTEAPLIVTRDNIDEVLKTAPKALGY